MTRFDRSLPIAALALALAACSPSAETSFADGKAAFEQHDFRTARVALIAGLKEQPGNLAMRSLLAQTQIALGDGEGAAVTLNTLTAEQKAQPEFATLIGETAVLRGQFDEAIKAVEGLEIAPADRVRALASIGKKDMAGAVAAFAAGAERKPDDARLLAAYSRFVLASGDVTMAQELADRAVAADGNSIEALMARATLAEARGDAGLALRSYDAVLKRHPANFDARVGKAGLLIALERFEVAKPMVAALYGENSESREVAYLRARVAASDGKWKEVRDLLQPYEADMRQWGPLRVTYGEALLELGLPSQALGMLEPMLRSEGGSRKLRLLVARARLDAQDAAGALKAIEPVVARSDATAKELAVAASAAKSLGNPQAASLARRAKSPTPQWIGSELAKGDRAIREERWQDAEQSYAAILERTGTTSELVLNNLAYSKMKLGDNEGALKLALVAVKTAPENASVLDTAGWLLVLTGERQRGIAMLEKAVRIAPDNLSASGHLAQARKN